MGFLDFIKNLFSNGKKNPKIIVKDLNKIYKSQEPLEIGLYDKEVPLANKEINIEINNVPYKRTTDENGIAKININLNIGKYRASIKFNEDAEYNSATAYADVYVNPKVHTSDLTMSYKDGNSFIAKLTDNENQPISGAGVVFKVNGAEYTRITNENGNAALKINLNPSTYTITTQINNININNKIIINEQQKQSEQPKNDKHFGYWIFGKDMYNVDLNSLKNNGVTDIFLNYYATEIYGIEKVTAWIQQAKPINVHIWMQCFYDGEWRNPKVMDLTKKIEEAKKYASIDGVAGVHLDYLRYPGNAYKTSGGTEIITEFVRQVRNAILNDIQLSCAVMPENEAKYYYGQDIQALGQIVNFITPMQYKGNYNAGTNWLASTTKDFSKMAIIWSGLQTYKSDDDTTMLSESELNNDIKTCLDNGAQGVLLFRYGLSPNIKFSTPQPTVNKIPTTIDGTNINMTYQDGTQYQCAVYDANGRISVPVDITINGKTYTRTPDSSGLCKLNINLNPGNYTINAAFAGNDTYLGSAISNTITINEAKKEEQKPVPSKLYDYFTQQGGGYLGQKTGYSCGCHSLVQCFHRLTGEDVSETTLMSVCGTTTQGTDHSGLETGVAWFNRTYNQNVKIKWMNFSDLGNNQNERFFKMQELINNGALFCHLLYRDKYGHYEVPKDVSGGNTIILNSLGEYCNYPAYCGYIENRSKDTQVSYINGISQKSIAYLYI